MVAGALTERAWAVMNWQMPYTPKQAKRINTEDFTVPDEVRRRRRSKDLEPDPTQRATNGGTPLRK